MASGTTTSTSGGLGSIHYAASGPITIGTLMTGGDVTIDVTNGSIVALSGVTNITAGGSLSLTALAGTVGTTTAPLTVAVTGPATMNATGLLDGVAIVANGIVGSTVPLFPPSVVGAVLWNGVDLNGFPAQPPVITTPVTTLAVNSSAITGLNVVADLNAAVTPGSITANLGAVPVTGLSGVNAAQLVLAGPVSSGSITANLSVVPVIGLDALANFNATIALLVAETTVAVALKESSIDGVSSTWYTETSSEVEDSSRAAVIRPPVGGRSAIQILDGGIRLPAGLEARPTGPRLSSDAVSDPAP